MIRAGRLTAQHIWDEALGSAADDRWSNCRRTHDIVPLLPLIGGSVMLFPTLLVAMASLLAAAGSSYAADPIGTSSGQISPLFRSIRGTPLELPERSVRIPILEVERGPGRVIKEAKLDRWDQKLPNGVVARQFRNIVYTAVRVNSASGSTYEYTLRFQVRFLYCSVGSNTGYAYEVRRGETDLLSKRHSSYGRFGPRQWVTMRDGWLLGGSTFEAADNFVLIANRDRSVAAC